MNKTHTARPVPREQEHVPWKPFVFSVVGLIIVLVLMALWERYSQFSPQTPAPTVNAATAMKPAASEPAISAPAVVENTAPIVVASAIPVIQLEWIEMGKVKNGEQVLALPIPWDRVVRLPYEQWDGKQLGITIPPATTAGIPLSNLVGYVPEEGKVTFYAYSNYYWSIEDPQGVTYWKAETFLSEVEELSP